MASADRTSVHLVADEEHSKRRQILDGACKVLLDLGFDAASMNEIARATGVSKGTLYVYFTDKCRLFDAILDEKALEKRQLAFYFDPACDISPRDQTGAAFRPRRHRSGRGPSRRHSQP